MPSYRGRWAWPMPPPCPPCSQPRRCRSRHQLRSDDGASGCGPHESQIWYETGMKCCHILTQSNMFKLTTEESEQWIKQREREGAGERYCVMKGKQMMSHTFLWAGHRRLSSSARWELGRRGPHTWTLHFGPLKPPGCRGDVQSWDALQRWKQHADLEPEHTTVALK